MKMFHYGILTSSYPTDPQPELVAQLAQETYNTDLLYHLVQHISRFEFESRKDVSQIFSLLLRRQIGSRFPTVEHITGKPDVIYAALKGYENEEVANNTGLILKEMLKHEPLAKLLLSSDQLVSYIISHAQPVDFLLNSFYQFNVYIENATFSVSCDAFANMKVRLHDSRSLAFLNILSRRRLLGTNQWSLYTSIAIMIVSLLRTLLLSYQRITSPNDSP